MPLTALKSLLLAKAIVLEIDEMWHFLKKTAQTLDLEGSGS